MQEALSESLTRSLACFELLKPTVAQLFVRFSFVDLFSFVPMTSRAALKNAAQKKRRRVNAMIASELVDSAMVPPDNEDGERTISDLATGEDDPEGMAIESIDEDGVLEQGTAQPEETLLAQAIKEAVTRLRGIKRLKTSAEVRAALPDAAFLEEKMVWVTQRVRALAVKCGFEPPVGMTRKVLLKMIEDFRLGREGGVLGEELLL